MAFATDGGGIAFRAADAKLQANASTWATRLSQLARQTGIVRIITYSLPSMPYVRVQLGRRPTDVWLICHSKFECRAIDVRREFPGIRVAVHDEVHSKVLLVAPHTVVVSSANFGDSTWHETSLSVHSVDAHDWYVAHVFQPLWNQSREVVDVR